MNVGDIVATKPPEDEEAEYWFARVEEIHEKKNDIQKHNLPFSPCSVSFFLTIFYK